MKHAINHAAPHGASLFVTGIYNHVAPNGARQPAGSNFGPSQASDALLTF